MMRPINSILVKRLSIDKLSGNCKGSVVGTNEYNFPDGKIVYYKLLDKKFYSIPNDMDNYDYLRLDCIFGVSDDE